MDRRKFLFSAGSVSLGGSALIGSGAFSRVESHRQVSIEVANDEDAYLGLLPGSSENGQNYVEENDHGHVEITIDDSGNDGFGVNSNSITFFDNLLQICNQGKENAAVWFDPTPVVGEEGDDELLGAGVFYIGESQGSSGTGDLTAVHTADGALDLPTGECQEIGLAVDTGKAALDEINGVSDLDIGKVDASDADEGEILINEEVTITADVGVEPEVTGSEDPVGASELVALTDEDDNPVNINDTFNELQIDNVSDKKLKINLKEMSSDGISIEFTGTTKEVKPDDSTTYDPGDPRKIDDVTDDHTNGTVEVIMDTTAL